MFFLYFFGFFTFSLIAIWLIIAKIKLNNSNSQRIKNYVIIVKNGQEKIEGLIRSINIWNYLKGMPIKITVVDLGSRDDTINILERLTYQGRKINRFYTADHIKEHQITALLEEFVQKGEEVILQYVNEE